MPTASPDLGHWPALVRHLATIIDLDASACRQRALVRRRGVRSAADLLHLALLYGPGGLSLRSTASFATEAGIADVCDVSLLHRLRKAGDFLAEILNQLLAHKRGAAGPAGRLRLALVDGSTVSSPGSQGSDWRLHARYEPACGGFTDLQVTEATTAEALQCVAVKPGDVLVQDRGYARLANFAHARRHGGAFITRIGWRSLRLSDASGAPLDLIAALPVAGPAIVERTVRLGAGPTAMQARLILARTPPEAAARQHPRIQRIASRKGQQTDPRTLQAAGFLMVVTSLSAEAATAEEVVALYRLRWQIELAFKRLKSLGGFDALRANDPGLVRTWLLAHLIAVVLVEASLGEELDSPLRSPLPRRRAAWGRCGGSGNWRIGG